MEHNHIMKVNKVRHKRSRPKWWVLYLILPLMVGLFSIEFKASISHLGHQITQIVIVLLILSIVWIWLGANEQALIQEEFEESTSSHQDKLYIVLSPEFLPLEEQISQRIQQDSSAGKSLAHIVDCLPDTKSDSSNHP